MLDIDWRSAAAYQHAIISPPQASPGSIFVAMMTIIAISNE
jgi:hypothetical protein